MNGPEILLILTLLRVIVPLTAILLLGEWLKRRQPDYRLRM